MMLEYLTKAKAGDVLGTCHGEDDKDDDGHVGLDVTLGQLENIRALHLHLSRPLAHTSNSKRLLYYSSLR